jgi:hypothetical protein
MSFGPLGMLLPNSSAADFEFHRSAQWKKLKYVASGSEKNGKKEDCFQAIGSY